MTAKRGGAGSWMIMSDDVMIPLVPCGFRV